MSRATHAAAAPERSGTVARMLRRTIAPGLLGSAVALVISVGMILGGVTRARPDETSGGLLATLLSVLVVATVVRSHRKQRVVRNLLGVGWGLQLSAASLYYYGDFAVDAASYHGSALRAAVEGTPVRLSASDWGTDGLLLVLTTLYRATTPSMLLGFVVFSALGLAGKVLFARSVLSLYGTLGSAAVWVAAAAVTLPSFVWWTGPISKESIVVLGMGIVLASLLRGDRATPSAAGIIIGLSVIALVRAHVTLLLASAVLVHLIVAYRLPYVHGGRRLGLLAITTVVTVSSVALGAQYLGADEIAGLPEERLALAERTAEGGSTVASRPIRSPIDIPPAVLTLVIRPFPWEAFSVLTASQSLEGVLLVLVVASLLLRRRGRRRRGRLVTVTGAAATRVRAIRLATVTYLGGFLYAFSSVAYNLGLVSRQRTQLWFPLLLLLGTTFVSVRKSPAGR